jgi:ABC-type antimicrobial peptide transport system, ATPase component
MNIVPILSVPPDVKERIAAMELQGISKIFHSETVRTYALQDIDLIIRAGEYVALMGPSGSGKTSLMAILGLLDRPSQGQQFLKGERVDGLSENQRALYRNRNIGFVFQSFNLIGDLSVFENVELPMRYHKGIASQVRRERVMEMLQAVGLNHRARHYPAQLSGGQAQRVAIARALVTEPSILLADEPTGNLDSLAGEQVMQLMESLHKERGTTLFMATHDADYAARAERILHLKDGKWHGAENNAAFSSPPVYNPE